MRAYTKVWIAAVAACLGILAVSALSLPPSFRLTAISDIIQCLLLFSGTLSFLPHAFRSRGRLRVFWSLIASGIGLWFLYQFVWIYYEIYLRVPVPDMCTGDVILFLHIVPLMAALALRPHAAEDEYAARLRGLDFALLLVWWVYLYVLFVVPWQYLAVNVGPYGDNLNSLYLIEKFAFLGALVMAWLGSNGEWKLFYANLFGAYLTYALSSHFANSAIDHHVYYSGSFYDVPLAASMAWITITGLFIKARVPQPAVRSISAAHGLWLARLGMIAAFSLPLFAAWALMNTSVPPLIRSFRVIATLSAALLMSLLVFVRQRLLDGELLRLLTHSRESIAHLKRLQTQITESEKHASIGQLVGGVAHELNNPITALLGYSDLLLNSPLTPGQKELAHEISQNARRTRSLVASLLTFAKQRPSAMVTVDLNSLLRTAVKLSEPQSQGMKIEVHIDLPQGLLPVQGDSNQLLQVFAQMIDDALNAAHRYGNRSVTLTAEQENDQAVVKICHANLGPGAADGQPLQAANNSTPLGLGLTACQGILRQHQGRISCEQSRNRTNVRVEIPLTPAPEKSRKPAAPLSWQPHASA